MYGAIHTRRAACDAAENIAAADHHGQLRSETDHFGHVRHHSFDGRAIDAKGIVAHQSFTGEFEQDAFIGSGHRGIQIAQNRATTRD
jgi:hypothetical protein